MKTIISTMFVVVVFAFSVSSMTFSTSAQAYEKEQQEERLNQQGKHRKHAFKRMAKYLQLTEEQRQQIKTIRTSAKDDFTAVKIEMKAFKEKAKALMNSDVFDEAGFAALHNEYQATFAQMALNKAKVRHAMLQVLTDEQKQKAMNMKGRMAEMFR